MTAVTKESDIPQMMKTIHSISSLLSKSGILLCVYTALRPGTAVCAEWSELNKDYSEWHIPAAKMKTKNDHITPLPLQMRPLLEQLKERAGRSPYVFPGERSPHTTHMHRDSLSKALRNAGLKNITVTHGFRATFRTIARERLKIDSDILEAQLAV